MARLDKYRRGLKDCLPAVIILLGLFFLLRLWQLTLFPIFADEAIYLRWTQVMRAEPTLRFLPLSDGKQPLFMWLTIPFLKLFADPLFAGRLLSVISGLGMFIGILAVTLSLFKKPLPALAAGLVFVVSPFFVFFTRMALVDSLLTMLIIWVFFLGIWLVRLRRIDLAMITGIVLGAALLTKSPAFFAVPLLPSVLFTADWLTKSQKSELKVNLAKSAGLWLIVSLFGFAVYNVLRLGPNFDLISSRNQDYLFPLSEVLSHPFNPLVPHLGDIFDWLPNLFTWPVLGFVFIGLWLALKNHFRILLALLPWTLVPLLFQLIFARVFTPRYLLPAMWPLVVFAGLGLAGFLELVSARLTNAGRLSKVLVAAVLVLLSVIPALWYDYRLLTDPPAAPLPRRMRSGYLEEWSSGYGIPEIRDYLLGASENRHIVVGTEGYFGTLPDGLQIYFDKSPNVTIVGVGLGISLVPPQLSEAALENPTFLVGNRSRVNLLTSEPAELVMEIPKAAPPSGETDSLLLYRLK